MWLKQQGLIFSQLWRLDVPLWALARVVSMRPLSLTHRCPFSPCPHLVSPLGRCISASKFPPFTRTRRRNEGPLVNLILPWSPLQRPYLRIWSYSKVLRVRVSAYEFMGPETHGISFFMVWRTGINFLDFRKQVI